jgi:glycosyltransferase involved in cell wall biosynthesis
MTGLHVCHLITGLDVGGAERNLLNVVNLFDPVIATNEVVSLLEPGPFANDLEAAGIPVTSLGMQRGYPNIAGLMHLVQHLRRSRPTILQTWLYHADLLGLLASPFFPEMRVIWNLRCSDLTRATGQWRLRCIVSILARVSGRPTAVIVNSGSGQQFHSSIGYRPRRWVQISNGVDTKRFVPNPVERAVFRAHMGIEANAPFIGLVARLHPMKDHATFLRAAASFKLNRPDARYGLCGNGCAPGSELEPLIESLGLTDRVLLLGARTNIENIYPAFDVVTMSSAYGEGFPNVLIEAMACGVACVATNVGDSSEILGDAGVIVPPGNPDALARGWERALLGTESFGASARRRVIEHYDIRHMRARYAELYESVARRVTVPVE